MSRAQTAHLYQHKQLCQPSGFCPLLWLQPQRVYRRGTIHLGPHLWTKILPAGHQKHLFFGGLLLLTLRCFGWWSVLSSSWKKVKDLNEKLPSTCGLFLVVTISLQEQKGREARRLMSPTHHLCGRHHRHSDSARRAPQTEWWGWGLARWGRWGGYHPAGKREAAWGPQPTQSSLGNKPCFQPWSWKHFAITVYPYTLERHERHGESLPF